MIKTGIKQKNVLPTKKNNISDIMSDYGMQLTTEGCGRRGTDSLQS